MNKILLVTALCLLMAAASAAQDASTLLGSKLTEDARFEILQSPFDKASTFRLDRFTGQIHRLSTCIKDDKIGSDKCWKLMTVENFVNGPYARGRYQIVFVMPSKLTLLFETDTGKAWQYGLDPINDKWLPFLDCNPATNSACLWRP